jgi:trehalose 6-phosphate synthase
LPESRKKTSVAGQAGASHAGRLTIVSNRLPVVLKKTPRRGWDVQPGSGGLVTAMAPVLRDRGGLWVGWPGTSSELARNLRGPLREAARMSGYRLEPVPLNRAQVDGFYYGFANEVLWPLFHDLPSRCNFDPGYWKTYLECNGLFARVVKEQIAEGDPVWVHDYHLMGVAAQLREMGSESRLGFFLHIPFPPLDIFLRLPWRVEVLESLLAYDLIGLQTLRDRRNFVQCARALLPGLRFRGKGQVVSTEWKGREIRLGAFPISIDFEEFAGHASSREVAERAWYLHEEFPNRQLLLGVDRLDYSKGIPERLRGFERALECHRDLHGKITLIQVVVPSRVEIPKYQALKTEIERIVSEINGRFTKPGWVPIHYVFRSLDREELLAFYRTAEIAIVTPVKDGMNLVAKEYCACNVDLDGALILSEFAGAAAQLKKGALLVNPHNLDAVSDAVHQAFHMPADERRERMKKLRLGIRRRDIYWWVDNYLQAVFAKDLEAFPHVTEELPSMHGV